MFAEMLTGQAIWPAKSDVDQLHHIRRTLGEPAVCVIHTGGTGGQLLFSVWGVRGRARVQVIPDGGGLDLERERF